MTLYGCASSSLSELTAELRLTVAPESPTARLGDTVALQWTVSNPMAREVTVCPSGYKETRLGGIGTLQSVDHPGCVQSNRVVVPASGVWTWREPHKLSWDCAVGRDIPAIAQRFPCDGEIPIFGVIDLIVGDRCSRRHPCQQVRLRSQPSTLRIVGEQPPLNSALQPTRTAVERTCEGVQPSPCTRTVGFAARR